MDVLYDAECLVKKKISTLKSSSIFNIFKYILWLSVDMFASNRCQKDRVSTNWPYFWRIFCVWSAISFSRFCTLFLRKYLCKKYYYLANWTKLRVLVKFSHKIKQLKVYSKIYKQTKLKLCYVELVAFSYKNFKLRDKKFRK